MSRVMQQWSLLDVPPRFWRLILGSVRPVERFDKSGLKLVTLGTKVMKWASIAAEKVQDAPQEYDYCR